MEASLYYKPALLNAIFFNLMINIFPQNQSDSAFKKIISGFIFKAWIFHLFN